MNHDKTFTNSIGMAFVPIPAGKFRMGYDGLEPLREVRIARPFYLGKYSVTQAQWQAVMGENPSFFKGPDRPVDNVSWEDAQAFIARLNAAAAGPSPRGTPIPPTDTGTSRRVTAAASASGSPLPRTGERPAGDTLRDNRTERT